MCGICSIFPMLGFDNGNYLIPFMFPNNGNCNFFPVTGSQYTQVYRKICESIRENLKVDLPPPPGSFRIQVSTKASKQ